MDWQKIKTPLVVLEVILLIVAIVVSLPPSPSAIESGKPPISNFCPPLPLSLDQTSGIGVTDATSSGEDVGLSEGKFVFYVSDDVPHDVKDFKCLASQALNQGKTDDAEQEWEQAVAHQSNDAEVLIYQENQRILDKGLRYISIIVGVSATKASQSLDILQGTYSTMDILQGAYAMQERYNKDHQNSTQLRVIIANFGSTSESATSVAKQIISVIQNDNRIKALVDLPAVADTPDVLNILSGGNFPIVLSTGSVNNQDNPKNVFRVAPTVAEQGRTAAQYVEQDCPNLSDDSRPFDCTGTNIAVFINTNDSYSKALGMAFNQQLRNDRKKDSQINNYSDPNSIKRAAQSLGAPAPDLIYFAGSVADADTLIQNLPKEYANVRVLGGDRLYQPHKYFDNDYSHLSFTGFAYPDEWDILPHQSPPPDFFCDYAIDFGGSSLPPCPIHTETDKSGYGYNRQDSNTILAYDALKIVLAEVTNASGTALSRGQLLQGIQNANAFPGVSGQITFGPDGNPINKAILVLRVNEHGFTRQEKVYGIFSE